MPTPHDMGVFPDRHASGTEPPGEAGAPIDRSVEGRSDERWMPGRPGCGDMEDMTSRRGDALGEPMSGAACPPIGAGGRWTALSHALFSGALVVAAAMASTGRARDPAGRAPGLAAAAARAGWDSCRIAHRGRAVARSLRPGIISEATVKTHLVHIFGTLGVQGRTEAVAVAVERGILRLES
jgi:hypothetical protein